MYNRVRFYRNKNGIKQDELAAKAAVGRSTISEIENNKHIPRVDTAIFISKALNEPVENIWII